MREGQEPKLIQNIMADGPDRNSIAIFAALLTLMLVCAIPMVSATGPGVSIVEDSINTTDFETFEEDFLELAFNLSSTNQGNSDTYSGQVFIETSLIDGTILTNNTIPFELEEGNVEVIIFNLTNMNFGYTIIEVSLTGDVGEVSENQIFRVPEDSSKAKTAKCVDRLRVVSDY